MHLLQIKTPPGEVSLYSQAYSLGGSLRSNSRPAGGHCSVCCGQGRLGPSIQTKRQQFPPIPPLQKKIYRNEPGMYMKTLGIRTQYPTKTRTFLHNCTTVERHFCLVEWDDGDIFD